MFDRIRTSVGRLVKSLRLEEPAGGEKRTHNLFEAASEHVAACAETTRTGWTRSRHGLS